MRLKIYLLLAFVMLKLFAARLLQEVKAFKLMPARAASKTMKCEDGLQSMIYEAK